MPVQLSVGVTWQPPGRRAQRRRGSGALLGACNERHGMLGPGLTAKDEHDIKDWMQRQPCSLVAFLLLHRGAESDL